MLSLTPLLLGVTVPTAGGPSGLWSFAGRTLPRVSDGEPVDVGAALNEGPGTSLLVLGTYPADFNMIEYAQQLTHYVPALKEAGVTKITCVVNGAPAGCQKLADLVGIPDDVVLLSDPTGEAGRDFGVSRGWMPDDATVPAYGKLFGMLLGLGASNTLPSVITGYLGNPDGERGWIESALAQGKGAGRWPGETVIETDGAGTVTRNAFDELPVVSSWGRRPLELATLRLQTMLGVSLEHWSELQVGVDDRCLTQLGGLVAVRDNKVLFEYRDGGICNVASFEKLLQALK